MKKNNVKIAWIVVIVVILVIAVSVITTSITGNVIKAKTSVFGTEVYTKDEVDIMLEDLELGEFSGDVIEDVECSSGQYLVKQSDGSWGCGDVSASSSTGTLSCYTSTATYTAQSGSPFLSSSLCGSGYIAVGGGYSKSALSNPIYNSYPNTQYTGAEGWVVYSSANAGTSITVYAVCCKII